MDTRSAQHLESSAPERIAIPEALARNASASFEPGSIAVSYTLLQGNDANLASSPAPQPELVAPVAAVPPSSSMEPLAVWPRSAQRALSGLLVAAILLLAFQGYRSSRSSTRPTEGEAKPWRRIDLNRAGRAELLQLPGMGDALAERVEAFRREQGAFRTVDELRQVRGIGPAALERLRPWVTVAEANEEEDDAAPASPAPTQETPSVAKKSTGSKTSSKKADKLAGPIDVNQASVEQLQHLPGIGPKMAQRIVDERGKSPFKSVEDLRRVSGIGPKTLDRLRPNVCVGGKTDDMVTTE